MYGFQALWTVIILVLLFIALGFFGRYPQYKAERKRTTLIVLGIVWLIGILTIQYQNGGF